MPDISSVRVLVFPGLDGTARLVEPFARSAPAGWRVDAVAYPRGLASESEYVAFMVEQVAQCRPTLIVAESFSGAILARAAHHFPDPAIPVVLVASFSMPPKRLLLWLVTLVPAWLARLGMGIAVRLFCLHGAGSKVELDHAIDVLRGCEYSHLRQRVHLLAELAEPTATSPNPAVLIRADSDRLLPAKHGYGLERVFPDLVIRSVSGPHFLLLGSPAGVWDAVVEAYAALRSA